MLSVDLTNSSPAKVTTIMPNPLSDQAQQPLVSTNVNTANAAAIILVESHAKKRHSDHWYFPRYIYIIILAIILLLTIKRLITHLRLRYSSHTSSSRLCRRARAIEAATRNWAYLSTLPTWLYGPDTYMDAICTGLYCFTLLFYAFWGTYCELLPLVSISR
jgi:hypothetical protein